MRRDSKGFVKDITGDTVYRGAGFWLKFSFVSDILIEGM